MTGSMLGPDTGMELNDWTHQQTPDGSEKYGYYVWGQSGLDESSRLALKLATQSVGGFYLFYSLSRRTDRTPLIREFDQIRRKRVAGQRNRPLHTSDRPIGLLFQNCGPGSSQDLAVDDGQSPNASNFTQSRFL
ncbi:hypothetical protein LZ554_006092 [Drepanopeziza brunnea f. sp. 'monogermtubi']|nr:hypothetical protein LZ554_006092 [Drepanopeziza brunnea f. sp. 'monogermtubi']